MSTQTKDTYNGWTDWETWNCNLWLTNEQDVYNDMQEILDTLGKQYKNREGMTLDGIGNALEELFKRHYGVESPDGADVYGANWQEIARNNLES